MGQKQAKAIPVETKINFQDFEKEDVIIFSDDYELLLRHYQVFQDKMEGLKLWEGGIILVRYMLKNWEYYVQKRVLDIGAGMGVVGIAASAFLDCEVMMLDYQERVIELCQKNTDLNISQFEPDRIPKVQFLDWNKPDNFDFDQVFDVLIGCELIYSITNSQALVRFLAKVLKPKTELLMIIPTCRAYGPEFMTALAQISPDLQVEEEILEGDYYTRSPVKEGVKDTFYPIKELTFKMLIITHKGFVRTSHPAAEEEQVEDTKNSDKIPKSVDPQQKSIEATAKETGNEAKHKKEENLNDHQKHNVEEANLPTVEHSIDIIHNVVASQVSDIQIEHKQPKVLEEEVSVRQLPAHGEDKETKDLHNTKQESVVPDVVGHRLVEEHQMDKVKQQKDAIEVEDIQAKEPVDEVVEQVIHEVAPAVDTADSNEFIFEESSYVKILKNAEPSNALSAELESDVIKLSKPCNDMEQYSKEIKVEAIVYVVPHVQLSEEAADETKDILVEKTVYVIPEVKICEVEEEETREVTVEETVYRLPAVEKDIVEAIESEKIAGKDSLPDAQLQTTSQESEHKSQVSPKDDHEPTDSNPVTASHNVQDKAKKDDIVKDAAVLLQTQVAAEHIQGVGHQGDHNKPVEQIKVSKPNTIDPVQIIDKINEVSDIHQETDPEVQKEPIDVHDEQNVIEQSLQPEQAQEDFQSEEKVQTEFDLIENKTSLVAQGNQDQSNPDINQTNSTSEISMQQIEGIDSDPISGVLGKNS